MFQQLLIIGNLGVDPELRYTASGQAVCNFTVATNRRWTDQNGQLQERTTWFRVAAWRKLGEVCAQYLSKGRQVMVLGTVETSAYTNQAGEPAASLEVTASQVKFLGSAGDYVDVSQTARPPVQPDEEIPF